MAKSAHAEFCGIAVTDQMTAEAAQSMMHSMFAPHELPLDDELAAKYQQTARDAIAAALAVAPCHGLLPIGLAPKDGTPFWGIVGDDAIRMFWHPKFEAFMTIHEPECWMPIPEGLP